MLLVKACNLCFVCFKHSFNLNFKNIENILEAFNLICGDSCWPSTLIYNNGEEKESVEGARIRCRRVDWVDVYRSHLTGQLLLTCKCLSSLAAPT